MRGRAVTSAAIAAVILVALGAVLIKTRGFRASSTPGGFETSATRLLRERFGIAHATLQVEQGLAIHPCDLAAPGSV